MNLENMVKFGLMKKLSTGEYVLTIKGQRIYSGKPDWKPEEIREKGTATKDNLQKMLLDAGFTSKLIWEHDPE
jgi:hypothetical protein